MEEEQRNASIKALQDVITSLKNADNLPEWKRHAILKEYAKLKSVIEDPIIGGLAEVVFKMSQVVALFVEIYKINSHPAQPTPDFPKGGPLGEIAPKK